MLATIIGFLGVAGFIWVALQAQSVWFGILAAFILMNCWNGWQQARALMRWAKLPRREGYTCPWCKATPPLGDFWTCGRCGQPFDTFQSQGVCPHCAAQFNVTQCLDCGRSHPMSDWMVSAPVISSL